ncbi:hypothetical protein Tco_0834857 [Tanacetum coccineum]
MGDANPIRTLRDYSKPSHEGYRNTNELLEGNNVVPLRSDTIQLVQNGCSFYGLRSEDPNQHLKDFLKLVDSLDLNGANRERTNMHLFQFSLHDQATNWLERLPARSISTCYPAKLERTPREFDSHQERRLSILGTQLGQQQDDMINKINTLGKVFSEKEDEAKEEGSVESSVTEYKNHEMTVEAKEEVESEVEFEEETEEEIKEEEEDNPRHFDTFLTMKE